MGTMTDEPFDSPKAKPTLAREATPGERLFAFRKGLDHYACELRDHGEFGIEAQFLLNGGLYIARTFQDQPEFSGRQLATQWADELDQLASRAIAVHC